MCNSVTLIFQNTYIHTCARVKFKKTDVTPLHRYTSHEMETTKDQIKQHKINNFRPDQHPGATRGFLYNN